MAPLKLAYNDDIRKIYVDNLTIATLHDNIKALFPDLQSVPYSNLFVYYIDDENDKIRLKLDIELSEAVRQFKSSNAVLKIFVQRLEIPSSTSTATPPIDVANLAPFFGMLNNVAPMLLNNPYAMQQMAAMLPTMMPLVSSILNPQSPNTNSVPFSPIVPSQAPVTQECGLNASPECSSVSTNTLVDARDVATETYLYGVTQTTQTNQQNTNTNQTTQTNLNANTATQTAQGSSATQTTQTNQNNTCATQTAKEGLASQTTQTLCSAQSCETQTQSNAQTCETQTQNNAQTSETQTQSNAQTSETQTQCSAQTCESQTNETRGFYDALAGTRFGGLLTQLLELGFTDREKCVQALVKNGGKLPEAIDELLLDQLLE